MDKEEEEEREREKEFKEEWQLTSYRAALIGS